MPYCYSAYRMHVGCVMSLLHQLCLIMRLQVPACLNHTSAWSPCRYKPFLIAEVSRSASGKGAEDPTGGDKGSAFKTLAGYLGKGNDRGQEIKMSTPVFSDRNKGTMQFYLGEGFKVTPADFDIHMSESHH